MHVVLDFITGKMGCEEFKEIWNNSSEIREWLENLIDLKDDPYVKWGHLPYANHRMAIYKHYNGSVLAYLCASEESRQRTPHRPKWLDIGWHFQPIAAVVVAAYPEIMPTPFYDEEVEFYLAVQGDYIGGVEVDEQIASLLERFPRTMGKAKRKREAKKAIRELFHVEGAKYPRWIQEPDWPMGKKSPMAFIEQKRTGDLVKFTFRDVDTGEVRIIEQIY